MKFILLPVIISAILQSAVVIEGINNNGKHSKWWLFNEDLFYVKSQKYFTSHEAQMFCIENDMVYIIDPSEFIGLGKLLTQHDDNIYPIWLLEEDFFYNRNTKNCTALYKNELNVINCATRSGVICKTKINGGSIQYRNGTHHAAGVNEVNRVCNPASREYDEVLTYCLLKFRRLLL